jgi:hypothetical protein
MLRGLCVPVGSVLVDVALNKLVVKRIILADEPTHDKRNKNRCDPLHDVSSFAFYFPLGHRAPGKGRGIRDFGMKYEDLSGEGSSTRAGNLGLTVVRELLACEKKLNRWLV